MRDYFDKAIKYFIYLAGGAGLCTLAWVVVAIPVRMMVQKLLGDDVLGELVIGTIIFALIMMSVMFLCGYKNGYKSGKLKAKTVVITMIIACLMHFCYSAVFQFSVYTTAPSFYLGAVIYHLTVQPFHQVPLPIIYRIMTLWAFDILYTVAVLLGERYGMKKRLVAREKLIKEEAYRM